MCSLLSHEKGRAPSTGRWGHFQPPLVSSAANEEYYQLLMSSENHPCSANVPSYTIEEIESVTSEFIVKNVVSVRHE